MKEATMPVRRTLELTGPQRAQLEEHRDHDPRPWVRERCAALLKIADGLSPHAVARHGLLKPRDPDTVYDWLNWYEKYGFWSVERFPQGGAHRRASGERRADLEERLAHGPGAEAREEIAPTAEGPPPSRWTLRAVRATFPWLRGMSLSGVWRVLRRAGLRLRAGRIRQYSPDPAYVAKRDHLLACLRDALLHPQEVVLVFLDEMGFYRWPEPGADWATRTPLAQRAGPNNKQWRIIGALNALTGQVTYRDAYIIGRAKVSAFYQQLVAAYPHARRIYVVQDNWSIHTHPDVLAAVAAWPHVEPVWLPTYAPWLNPIEKLWRWLRQDILRLHRLAGDWEALHARVTAFLDQFAAGSHDLLHYVGLLGDGRLAEARQAA
jgi:transposase